MANIGSTSMSYLECLVRGALTKNRAMTERHLTYILILDSTLFLPSFALEFRCINLEKYAFFSSTINPVNSFLFFLVIACISLYMSLWFPFVFC
nr:hypothetical protein Q903MT_gene3659 [Picea sitchensis]